jgi:S1-C subfamily serine protease
MLDMKDKALPLILFFLISVPKVIEESGDAYRGLASSWTIIPSRSLAGLHYIFKGFKITDEESLVQVTGPVVQITNGETLGAKVFKEGYSSEVTDEDFEQEQTLGTSVFEATTGSGNNVGTAFLVGQNIVLTNRHVLALKPQARVWSCGKFSIKLNHKEEKVDCRKVRFCSRKYDYCVVEMNAMANLTAIGSEVKPLRLSQMVKSDQDARLLHIGNAAGLGIQASSGRGLKIESGEFYHYAPTLGGSSGAPIFNDRGEVIGINWGHTGGNYIEEGSFNRGVLAVTIFDELRRIQPKTVQEIKSFRSWFQRISRHRNVKIHSLIPTSGVR